MMGLLLVVNLHGQINVRREVRSALKELRVDRRFSATVVRDDPSTLGLLDLSRDYVAWAPLDEELLASLLEARGKVSERKKLDGEAIRELGFKGTDELASKMMKGEMRLSSVKGLRPFFNLAPPRGGFKVSTRRKFGEGGVLGMNPKLPDLVRRMI
ncbi:MAG: 50S ribosomal protein L30 [Thaumarchaeota archaeon]|nr:MAG: 50S ribosomal protein L30 [Nitrososphaerota archaeon]